MVDPRGRFRSVECAKRGVRDNCFARAHEGEEEGGRADGRKVCDGEGTDSYILGARGCLAKFCARVACDVDHVKVEG